MYDHNIRFEWKELFGPGNEESFDSNGKSISASYQTQDKRGKWHSPCDTGIWITLWHPNNQEFQEKVGGYWMKGNAVPHWRPIYNYTRQDVVAALKIMCREFGWEFEETKAIPKVFEGE